MRECSFRRCHSAFTFRNQTASAIDGQRLCPVTDFRLNANYKKFQNYTVAVIGDSLDLHGCFELMKRSNRLAYDVNGIPVPGPAMKPPQGLYDCYNDGIMQVKFYRIGGIMDSTGIVRSDGNAKINFLTAVKPQAIVFSSIVHDIRNNHLAFCKKKMPRNASSTLLFQRKCLCNHEKMTTAECLNVSTPHVYNQIEMPWCDEDFVDSWRSAFTNLVTEIRTALPNASLFLRNQPFASQVQLGQQICLGSLNNILREVASSLIAPHDNNSCRFMDMNALLSRAASQHMGTTTSYMPRDGLHYFQVAHIWTDYMYNMIVDNVAGQ